jgi:hypothetical protein
MSRLDGLRCGGGGVLTVKKDRFADIATDHDVVNGARKMYTRFTRHGKSIDWNV